MNLTIIRGLAWGYLIILFVWLGAYFITGDQLPWIALTNLVAVYFFAPLPLVLLAALGCRSRSLGVGFALGLLAFAWLWGAYFVPRPARAQAGEPSLTVLTYNVLAFHRQTGPIIATIRSASADVVFIQELNHTLAAALQSELAGEYPYQVLNPRHGAVGSGTLSRYPLRPTGESLPHPEWIGAPQILELDWDGRPVRLVNFHLRSTPRVDSLRWVAETFRWREEQARLLTGYARRARPIPVILGGDANAGPLNGSYRILAGELQDAWRQGGFGLGHTFPGSTIPGSDRPRIGRFYVPPWLARIDYIFHTGDWETVTARLAQVDGVSDHRGVIAVLRLRRP